MERVKTIKLDGVNLEWTGDREHSFYYVNRSWIGEIAKIPKPYNKNQRYLVMTCFGFFHKSPSLEKGRIRMMDAVKSDFRIMYKTLNGGA